ncbi:hypothetical protein L873DRAFT_1700758 [Choiromyces venosus 120613-1]|uniref:Cleavage and polyadenylation specificity factor subunit 2 n=1 Tax=Choiromyces venosus 120613-1 TaxID=1336337 RepID=A0A3N4JCC8_9PEZI|nr:hypothetical protein L873DRAFT_1700758 [Choiromyces venosus 120613-1]
MFLFTPLLGAQSDSQACQSLLELENGIKVLIDVGWDESFDVKLLAELERHAPTIDLILLTHPTLAHMGAYAHACKHIPNFSSIPVYSTFPVSNLGRLLLQDIYLSTPLASTRLLDSAAPPALASNFSAPSFLPPGETGELHPDALKLPPTSAEIDSYCTKIVTLKYSQPTPLHSAVARVSGKLGSITITAYSAGHSLGGTIWKIQQVQESIVYAVDWNHSRENCLRGAGFLSGGGVSVETLGKPTALICSARNSEVVSMAGGRKKRDEILLDAIKKTALEKGGTVLIPTDSVGRVLELVYLLEHAWRKDQELSSRVKGKGVGLFLAGRRVRRLGQVVGSMLEWMDEGVVREFESIAGGDRRGNRQRDDAEGKGNDGNKAGPFDFLHLNLVSTQGHLNRILNDGNERGKVIIASDSSLGWGFSREALMKLASDERNLVVLTERSDGKLGWAGNLWQQWKEKTNSGKEAKATGWQDISLDGQQAELDIPHRTPLEGQELDAYNRHLAAQQALTSQHQSLLSNSGLPSSIGAEPDDDDASSSSDDDSDSERQGKALTTANSKKISAATVMLGGATPSGYGAGKVDIGINILLRGKGVYDYDVRGAKGRNRMFPFVMRRRRVDEYGEIVRADEYMRAEEKAEEDLLDATGVKEERVMGKKRKWDENEAKKGGPGARKGKEIGDVGKKRRTGKTKDRPDGDDSYEPDDGEQETEEGEVEEDEAEDEESMLTVPSKITYTKTAIPMRFKVAFIDFAGLHDSRILRMLLPLISPRKLILVGGREHETKSLANDCRKLLSGRGALSGRGESGTDTDVFFPQIGNKVNAGVDTNAWAVKLSDNLVRNLKWQNVRGLGVVHVIGRVTEAQDKKDESRNGKKVKLSESPEAESKEGGSQVEQKNALVLDVLPPALAAATRSVAQPIHVGDIRLADLRRVLLDDGLTAEFRGEGTLLIDGVVVVRKGGVGSVIIEDGGGGMLRRAGRNGKASFVEVRKRIYEGLAVVSGG